MPEPDDRPSFAQFTRWLARADGALMPAPQPGSARFEQALAAARHARQETLHLAGKSATSPRVGNLEVLELLAAADASDTSRPPELTTPKGFRVTLAYDDGGTSTQASIAVLVQCPPDRIAALQGRTVFLWSGEERFELGQFDADGKALGTLPAGLEITLSDFKMGRIKIEEPPPDAEG